MQELFGFLKDKSLNVRQIAIENIAGLTGDKEYIKLFTSDVVQDLMSLIDDDATVAHEAIKALINLSAHEFQMEIMGNLEFIKRLILLIIVPTTVIADLCCMLLNNLTKNESVILKIMSDEDDKTGMLDNLIEVFAIGEGKRHNSNADFHFLAGVFSNLTMQTAGARFMLGHSKVDGQFRLLKIIAFLGHDNLIRRGGSASVVKNCCFDIAVHSWLLTDPELNLLPYILLPLTGPEEYDDDDLEGMPDELQLLPSDKKREKDGKIRLIFVETILLLCSSAECRDILRNKKVYAILQKMDLVEDQDYVKETIERIVQFLARDEPTKDLGIQKIEE